MEGIGRKTIEVKGNLLANQVILNTQSSEETTSELSKLASSLCADISWTYLFNGEALEDISRDRDNKMPYGELVVFCEEHPNTDYNDDWPGDLISYIYTKADYISIIEKQLSELK